MYKTVVVVIPLSMLSFVTSIHTRISPKAKELLDRLKLDGGYKTYDQALLSLILSPGQPSKALTITNLLNRPDVNKLIGETASALYHNYVKPKPRPKQSRPKTRSKQSKHSSSFKSRHKF